MSQAGLKIAILYDTWEDDAEEPAAPAEEVPPPRRAKRKRKSSKRARRPKLDREEIFDALGKLGHEPSYLVLDGRDQSLMAVARCNADLIFNLTESYAGDDTKDMNLAAYLELLDQPFTGAGPHALYLAQDKSLAKKVFHFHKIRTPFFAVSYKGRLDHAHDIEFPLIVKPLSEDGSIGIDASSVVGSVKELMEKIHYIHEQFDSPALIEEYIEGREIYAAVLGEEKAVAAYQALKLRDYGRIDMRLTDKGEIYVLEANPNPWLSSGAEFAMAARKSGRTYTDLMRDIVDLAMARYA